MLKWESSGEQSISLFFFFSESLGYSMCQITVTNMDGKPVADRTVLLDLNENYLANYTTDKNGTAAFSIDTSNIFDPSFKLSVSKYSLIPEKNTSLERGITRNQWVLAGLFQMRKVGGHSTNTCNLCETSTSKHQCLRSGRLHPRSVWAAVIFNTSLLFPPLRSPSCSHLPSLYSVR